MDGSLLRVAASTGADGLIALLGVNAAGELYFRKQVRPNVVDPSAPGGWSAWERIDMPASAFDRRPEGRLGAWRRRTADSAAMANDLGGRLNLFVLTRQGQVFQSVRAAAGQYTNWMEIPGAMRAIAAAKEGGGAGRLVLVGQGSDGQYYENTSTGLLSPAPGGFVTGPWRGWRALPNPPFP